MSSLVAVGALIHVLLLRPLPGRKAFPLPAGSDLTILRWASAVWAVAALALIPLYALDTAGVPLSALGQPGITAYVVDAASNLSASIIRFAFAAIVALTARTASRWTTLLIGLWAAAIAVLTPIVVGQVLVGPNHDLGLDAAVIQAVAAYPTFGVLVVLAIRSLLGSVIATVTWRRWLRMAVVALPLIALAEVVVTWFKLAGTPLLASATGWLMLVRWAALALIVTATIAVVVTRRRRRFRRAENGLLALASVGVFSWVAVAAAMLRKPPPQYDVPTSVNEVFLGFDPQVAPTFAAIAGTWRPNLLYIAIAVAGIAVYLGALVVVRRRGIAWPLGRTVSWILGWVFAVMATSSGLGYYSAPHFGIHMIMHMSLSMLVPVLLALGGPLTLLLRAGRAGGPVASLHDWVSWLLSWRVSKALYNPLVAFVLFISSYYALYFTDLFQTLMRYHWGHQLMNVHFLVVGYIYYSLIIGVDRGPKPLPHIAKLGMAMAAMPFHAFFGVILMNGRSIIGQDFYRMLDIPWADLPAAQELGGGVAWAGGEIPSLLVVVALGIQWARQDRKEAARRDRHMDTGRDTEYEDYNAMLAALAERGTDKREGSGR
ncbi:cytochrome c oxidase assembly protein [Tessaracoccus sp. HDW20]|nr:cytochrome c oxidase assembly protein [Tessaracoccus coleopterorum]